MDSKLAQVQQLPPPSKPPILAEIEQLRIEIAEIKITLDQLDTLIRFSAAPQIKDILHGLKQEIQDSRGLLPQIQKIVHNELEAALKHSKKWIDALPKKILEAMPQPKKGLFG